MLCKFHDAPRAIYLVLVLQKTVNRNYYSTSNAVLLKGMQVALTTFSNAF